MFHWHVQQSHGVATGYADTTSAAAAVLQQRRRVSTGLARSRVQQSSSTPTTSLQQRHFVTRSALRAPIPSFHCYMRACVTTETRPLHRLGQLSEFEQDSNTASGCSRAPLQAAPQQCRIVCRCTARKQTDGSRHPRADTSSTASSFGSLSLTVSSRPGAHRSHAPVFFNNNDTASRPARPAR